MIKAEVVFDWKNYEHVTSELQEVNDWDDHGQEILLSFLKLRKEIILEEVSIIKILHDINAFEDFFVVQALRNGVIFDVIDSKNKTDPESEEDLENPSSYKKILQFFTDQLACLPFDDKEAIITNFFSGLGRVGIWTYNDLEGNFFAYISRGILFLEMQCIHKFIFCSNKMDAIYERLLIFEKNYKSDIFIRLKPIFFKQLKARSSCVSLEDILEVEALCSIIVKNGISPFLLEIIELGFVFPPSEFENIEKKYRVYLGVNLLQRCNIVY